MEESIPPGFSQQAVQVFNQQSSSPDPITSANFANEMERARLESYRQDTHERLKYARYIFLMVALWLLGIFIVVVCRGMKTFKTSIVITLSQTHKLTADVDFNFELSDTVMVALITTTTINVAAFFLAVTKYLFPSKPEPANGV